MGFANKASRALVHVPGDSRTNVHPNYFVQPGLKGQPYRDNWDPRRAVDLAQKRSVWVYRCIEAIATNQAKLPMVVRQDNWYDGKEMDSDVLDILNYKSSEYELAMNFRKRISQQVLLNQQGCMIECIRTNGGELKALHILPAGYTWPIPDPDIFVKAFRVHFPGDSWVDIDPANVLWLRNPHPLDPYSGMTPLEAAGINIELDWYTRLYNRNFMANDMRPGGLLVIKGAMSQPDMDELRMKFGGGGPGYNGAGRLTAIQADSGADFVDTGQSPRDGHYLALEKMTREAIMMAFGVPESIIGNASGRTFDNADAEKEIFWEETMLPHMEIIARGLDDAVDPDPRHFASFDWGRVPVLERPLNAKRDRWLKEVAGQVRTVDEYRSSEEELVAVGATKLYNQSTLVAIIDTQHPFEDVPQGPVGDPAAGPFGSLPPPDYSANDPMSDFGLDPNAAQPGTPGAIGPDGAPAQDPAFADAASGQPAQVKSLKPVKRRIPKPAPPAEWW